MTEQMALDFREHDLPPKWDGDEIEWDTEWRVGPPMFICPPPPPDVCRSCGRDAPLAYKRGIITHPNAVWTDRYGQIQRGPSHENLFAFRCSHCGADDVLDTTTGESWMLGPEDYGPRGSYLIDTEQARP